VAIIKFRSITEGEQRAGEGTDLGATRYAWGRGALTGGMRLREGCTYRKMRPAGTSERGRAGLCIHIHSIIEHGQGSNLPAREG